MPASPFAKTRLKSEPSNVKGFAKHYTRSLPAYFGHLVFFAAALFTKETAAALCAVVLLHRYLYGSGRLLLRDGPVLAAGWLPVIFAWHALRLRALGPGSGFDLTDAVPVILNGLPSLVQYLGKFVFPLELSVLPFTQDASMLPGIAASAFFLLGMLALRGRRYGGVLFGSVWYLLFFLPALAVVRNYALEHRLYIPAIGLVIILLEFREAGLRLPEEKRTMPFVVALAGFLCAALTYAHCDQFAGKASFWAAAADTSPRSALAHARVAMLHLEAGALDKAGESLDLAEQLGHDPREIFVYRGTIAALSGDLAGSERAFLAAERLAPGDHVVLYNLSGLRFMQDRHAEAEHLLRRTIALEPRYLPAYQELAAHLLRQGRLDEAARCARECKQNSGPRLYREFLRSLPADAAAMLERS